MNQIIQQYNKGNVATARSDLAKGTRVARAPGTEAMLPFGHISQGIKSAMKVTCGDIFVINICSLVAESQILATLLRGVCGEQTKSEKSGLGYYATVPWHQGINR